MAEFDAQSGRGAPPEPQLSAAQREADELDLHAGLAGVAGIVAGARGLSEMLCQVAEFAVRAIPRADGAGITLTHSGAGSPDCDNSAVTAQFVGDIDAVQYQELGEGPGITCMRSRRGTVSGSLGCDGRWPRFGGRVARMGVHSALALPLIVGDHVIGAVTAYAHARDAFAEHAVALGSQFAGPAAVAMYNAGLLDLAREQSQRLQRALEGRAMIDQAIGIVRSRSGDDARAAFERLVRISQAENTKVNVVAERLVEEAVRRAQARHQ